MGSTYAVDEKKNSPISDKDLARLLELVKNVRYGSVTLVIQDGKVIQFEKNEKVRLI